MTPPPEIMPGSRVSLHLALSTTDGIEAISTFGGEPTEFTLGDGTISEGLELALYGLRTGEEQTVTLNPHQAFGPRDESRIHKMPKQGFDPGMALEPGQVIAFEGPNGEELAGLVLEIEEKEVTVDFNHPLAGRELLFKVEIVQVSAPA